MADADSSKAKILDAARHEFAAVGFAGARVDSIARNSGCNKQLIYHYYGDKEGLFKAVLLQVLSERPPVTMTTQEDLPKQLEDVMEHMQGKKEWLRMMMWEVLQSDPDGPVVAEELRREHLDESCEDMCKFQRLGLLDADLPPRFVMLVMMGLLSFPATMPHLARILTGMKPDSPEFRAEYLRVVMRLVQGLGR